jgi:hypothetical protein
MVMIDCRKLAKDQESSTCDDNLQQQQDDKVCCFQNHSFSAADTDIFRNKYSAYWYLVQFDCRKLTNNQESSLCDSKMQHNDKVCCFQLFACTHPIGVWFHLIAQEIDQRIISL